MIDTKTVESQGWWAKRLADRIDDNRRRLAGLGSYMDGEAPLPEGAEGFREAYRAFQRKSRTNFAEIIVEAVQERMTVTGFRIGEDTDKEALAARIWSINEMDTASADVHTDMLGYGRGIVIVGPPEAASPWDWLPWRKEERIPVITREDPLSVAVEYDPQNPTRVIAALKAYHDGVANEDVLYLYLPGEVFVARRRATENGTQQAISSYEWTGYTKLPHKVMPVVAFDNKRGLGEFEAYTDILQRIDYLELQIMVISAMQAYRQRVVKGDLPEKDEAGNPIDYGAIFRPGVGSMWMFPEGVDIWESQSTDIRPLIDASKSARRDLAACTRTPMSMLLPDSQNQSAEGASFAREGLVFKAGDRIRRATYGWNQVMQLALLFADQGWQRDIEALWLPPERQSLAERADASVKATDLPFSTKLRKIWGFSESEAERIENERMADILAMSLSGETDGV